VVQVAAEVGGGQHPARLRDDLELRYPLDVDVQLVQSQSAGRSVGAGVQQRSVEEAGREGQGTDESPTELTSPVADLGQFTEARDTPVPRGPRCIKGREDTPVPVRRGDVPWGGYEQCRGAEVGALHLEVVVSRGSGEATGEPKSVPRHGHAVDLPGLRGAAEQ
jgi:hypothetical protein